MSKHVSLLVVCSLVIDSQFQNTQDLKFKLVISWEGTKVTPIERKQRLIPKSTTSHRKNRPQMMSNDCPPFLAVMDYLVSAVISVAMFLYLLIFLSLTSPIQPLAYAFVVAFILMIINSCYNLNVMLFPARAGQSSIQH